MCTDQKGCLGLGSASASPGGGDATPGIVVGVLAAVSTVAALAVYWRRRHSPKTLLTPLSRGGRGEGAATLVLARRRQDIELHGSI